jgi:hypothetical protein
MSARVIRHQKVDKPGWGGRNGLEPSSPGWSPGAWPWLCYSRAKSVGLTHEWFLIVTCSRPRVSFAHGALFVIRNELGVGNSLLLDAYHTYSTSSSEEFLWAWNCTIGDQASLPSGIVDDAAVPGKRMGQFSTGEVGCFSKPRAARTRPGTG